jgi:hypothetical protein
MSTLTEIERAAEGLPQDQQERLFEWLCERRRAQRLDNGLPHSVLDIAPVSLGRVLRPLSPDDDLLEEMLRERQ